MFPGTTPAPRFAAKPRGSTWFGMASPSSISWESYGRGAGATSGRHPDSAMGDSPMAAEPSAAIVDPRADVARPAQDAADRQQQGVGHLVLGDVAAGSRGERPPGGQRRIEHGGHQDR